MFKFKYLFIFTTLVFCLSACSQSKTTEQSGETIEQSRNNTEVTKPETTEQSESTTGATESETYQKILEIQATARELADKEKEMVEAGDISRGKTLWYEAMDFIKGCPDYLSSNESIESAILYGYYVEYINEEYSDVDDVISRHYGWRIGKNLAEVASKVYTNEIDDSTIDEYLTKIKEDLACIYGE